VLEILKKIVKSPYFKEILRLALAALAGASASGCAGVPFAAVPPQVAVYECQLAALADAVPPEVAQDVVMAARAGQIQYVVGQLASFGLDFPRIERFVDAFNACLGESIAPEAPKSLIET
jgi:hypothetical protein